MHFLTFATSERIKNYRALSFWRQETIYATCSFYHRPTSCLVVMQTGFGQATGTELNNRACLMLAGKRAGNSRNLTCRSYCGTMFINYVGVCAKDSKYVKTTLSTAARFGIINQEQEPHLPFHVYSWLDTHTATSSFQVNTEWVPTEQFFRLSKAEFSNRHHERADNFSSARLVDSWSNSTTSDKFNCLST